MKDKENILNINDLGKFVTPNGEKIRSIRENEFQIPQSNIEIHFIRHKISHKGKDGKQKSNVSLRTYQRIEKGENDVNKKFVKDVAILFTKLYKSKLNKDKHISLNDLITDTNIKKDPKSFDIYLNRINSFDELTAALNLTSSKYSKSFFNCNIDSIKQISIESLYKEIDQINSYYKKQNNPNDEIGFKKDLDLLKLSTNVNSTFSSLKLNKICVYMGVLKKVPITDINIISNHKDNGPYDPVEVISQINSKVELRDYLILNFTDCSNGFSIDMNFKSDWTIKELENTIEKNSYFEEVREIVSYDEFHEFGFDFPIEKVSDKVVNFYSSKKIDLPWNLRKNQFNFRSSEEDTKMIFEDYDEFMDEAREAVKEEIISEHEDDYADAMRDMMREDSID
jgi:hypothetical protein